MHIFELSGCDLLQLVRVVSMIKIMYMVYILYSIAVMVADIIAADVRSILYCASGIRLVMGDHNPL